MKKVCHVISGYHRLDARVFQRQCKTLQNEGYEVCILTNDGLPEEVIEDIKIYSCDIKMSRIKTLLFASQQFLKKAILIDADIYQLHSPELLPLGIKLKELGKKIIYDAHEDLPRHILEKEWIPQILRRPTSFLSDLYLNYVLPKFDYVITPHTHVLNYYSNKGVRINLITNFPIVKGGTNFTFEDYLKRDDLICYTGTVYEYSNQELLLETISSFKGLKYHIAGFIGDKLQVKMKSYLLKDRVKFHGRIPWNDLPKFYNMATIGYVVYDYKLNLGYKLGSYGTNKIFEYMEEGLPFICTDYVLWKGICEKYNCGLFIEPNNKLQLKKALQYLLDNKEMAYQMGQNGKKAVEIEYNWNTQAAVYLEIFKNLY